jgi:hypothetical protein
LLIEGSGINLYFIYDLEIEEEQKQQYINDLELYKNIIKHLFSIINISDARKLCTYYFNNNQILYNLDNLTLKENSDFYLLFNLLKDLVELLPAINKVKYNSCETCGDCNYNYDIRVFDLD